MAGRNSRDSQEVPGELRVSGAGQDIPSRTYILADKVRDGGDSIQHPPPVAPPRLEF
jgi:hypothetical protein